MFQGGGLGCGVPGGRGASPKEDAVVFEGLLDSQDTRLVQLA